jgi:hypothetical protein
VAPPVAELDILKPVPFLRKRMEALCQKRMRVAENRQFPGPGFEQDALNRDDIADIEQEKLFIALGADDIFPQIDLEFRPAVGNMEKGRPAHLPDGQDSARDFHADFLGFKLLFGQGRKVSDDIGNGMGPCDLMRKRIDTLLDEPLELLLAS